MAQRDRRSAGPRCARLPRVEQIRRPEAYQVGAVEDALAELPRGLVEVDRADKAKRARQLQHGPAGERVRRRNQLRGETADLALAGRPFQRLQEAAEIMLDLGQIHFIQADDVQPRIEAAPCFLLLGPDQEGIQAALRRLKAAVESVGLSEQVAHVEPGRADADVEVTGKIVLVFVSRQRLGVKTRQR